ncbi:MAG: NAD(P)/FAD-dependent oxidoreductase [Dehalococcoidia bacterium]|nr:NAD(P)/FAD-dependent oxidoreductase [Dehalococcoidia bacterium]
MSASPELDIAIVGGGVVGLACAVELSRTRQLAVIERRERFGLETSSHNSGVIHAGIYYPTGSLKHTLCLEGNPLLYAWADAHGVPSVRLGKLIIAVDDDDRASLAEVRRQADANGVPGMRLIEDRGELRELEPSVRCVAALYSASTGVIDQTQLMASFAREIEARGGWLALKHEVTAVDRLPEGAGFAVRMRGPDGRETAVEAQAVLNSAGLRAPDVAAMLGYPLDGGEGVPPLRQTVNKGRYYDIVDTRKARALRHLVYPVPEHAKGGLGVHVTIDVGGLVHLGPDTEWLDDGAPLDYRADDLRRADFLAAAQRYLPALETDDIAPGQVGYRPKLQRPGGPIADFLIWHDRSYVHLGGIESPGMTASLAIARRVATLL